MWLFFLLPLRNLWISWNTLLSEYGFAFSLWELCVLTSRRALATTQLSPNPVEMLLVVDFLKASYVNKAIQKGLWKAWPLYDNFGWGKRIKAPPQWPTLILLQQVELQATGAGDVCAVPGGTAAQWSPPMQSESSEQGWRQLWSHSVLPGQWPLAYGHSHGQVPFGH